MWRLLFLLGQIASMGGLLVVAIGLASVFRQREVNTEDPASYLALGVGAAVACVGGLLMLATRKRLPRVRPFLDPHGS